MAINSTSSMLRVGGLVSGLDTEALIKSLMSAQQSKMDRLFRDKVALQYKKESLTNVSSMLTTFKNDFLSMQNLANSMVSSQSYMSNTTNLDKNSYITVSANSEAIRGNYTIDDIVSMAANEKISSAAKVSGSEAINPNLKLSELSFANGAQVTASEIRFTINGELFEFNNDTTLREVMSAVNNNTKANVSFTYSALSDSFSITSKDSSKLGADGIRIQEISGGLFGSDSLLGMDTTAMETIKDDILTIENSGMSDADKQTQIDLLKESLNQISGYQGATDAKIIVNGHEVTSQKNTFTIDGMTFTVTKAPAPGETFTPLDFRVEQDVEAPMARIKEFVNKYNELIDKLNGLLSETKYRDYKPLTDDERSGMTEKEAELWDAQAKSGTLRNDSMLSSLVSTMRSAFSEVVGDLGKSASAVGIKVANYFEGGKLGKLVVDDDALKTALTNNPDEVMAIFTSKSKISLTSDSTSAERAQHRAESGIITRLSDEISKYTDYLKYTTMSGIDETLRQMSNKQAEQERQYTTKEEQLWAKYAAMEQQLANLNSQSSWIGSNMI